MTAPPRQLVLDLAHRSALGAEDFLVSRSNAAAVDLVDRWPAWPHWAALVVGPAGSGKTHLANVWQLRSGAEAIAAARLSEAAVAELSGRSALAVEDLDRGIAEERVLFHLLNLAREHKLSILLTSRLAAGELDVGLPDLRSRLRALPLVRIESPDEALLQGVLVKLFADRQLDVEPHVVSFLARRMERSMAAATRTVAEVDRLALALQRKVTRGVAAAALGASEADEEGH
jgi:chromosomal replication initiation ATPase DnaA